jgi:hypothetical protein
MDDGASPLELAFLALQARPVRYAEWAAEVRAAWEATPDGKAAVLASSRHRALEPKGDPK